MFKAFGFVLGLVLALSLATDAAQAAGGCGPYRYRGVFNQCWLIPPSSRPVARRIDRVVVERPIYVRYRRPVRIIPVFYGGGRPVRYTHYRRSYHYSHYSYHYSYHFSRHYSFRRNVRFGPRIVGHRRFVDQRRNLINEGRFLNRVFHRNVHRYF